MDVMEAVRLTQLKMDRMAEDISQVRQLVQSLQQNGCQPERSSVCHAQYPAEADTQQLLTAEDLSRQHRTTAGERHAGRQPADAGTSLLVIGDSNVRRLEGMSERGPSKPAFHSISGATTEHVRQDISQAIRKCGAKRVVIHAGTNDVTRKGSELVAKDIFSLADQTKRRDGVSDVFICSIIPRKDTGSFIYSRSESVNNRLRTLCSES